MEFLYKISIALALITVGFAVTAQQPLTKRITIYMMFITLIYGIVVVSLDSFVVSTETDAAMKSSQAELDKSRVQREVRVLKETYDISDDMDKAGRYVMYNNYLSGYRDGCGCTKTAKEILSPEGLKEFEEMLAWKKDWQGKYK